MQVQRAAGAGARSRSEEKKPDGTQKERNDVGKEMAAYYASNDHSNPEVILPALRDPVRYSKTVGVTSIWARRIEEKRWGPGEFGKIGKGGERERRGQ